MAQKHRYICASCGSSEIWRDAAAIWDNKSQSWELLEVYDDIGCNICSSSDIITVEIDNGTV